MSLNTMLEKTSICGASHKQKDHAEIEPDIISTGVALSANEVVNRYGSANAEFIKGYAGLDNKICQQNVAISKAAFCNS